MYTWLLLTIPGSVEVYLGLFCEVKLKPCALVKVTLYCIFFSFSFLLIIAIKVKANDNVP